MVRIHRQAAQKYCVRGYQRLSLGPGFVHKCLARTQKEEKKFCVGGTFWDFYRKQRGSGIDNYIGINKLCNILNDSCRSRYVDVEVKY
jgi:hypothetical protein